MSSGEKMFFTLVFMCTIIDGGIQAAFHQKENESNDALYLSYYANQCLSFITSLLQYFMILYYHNKEIPSKDTLKGKLFIGFGVFMIWYNLLLFIENIYLDWKYDGRIDDYLTSVMMSLTLAGAIEFRLHCALDFFAKFFFPLNFKREESHKKVEEEDEEQKTFHFTDYGNFAAGSIIVKTSLMFVILFGQVYLKSDTYKYYEIGYLVMSLINDSIIIIALVYVMLAVSTEKENANLGILSKLWDFSRITVLILGLAIYYFFIGVYKIVFSKWDIRYILIGADYFANTFVEIFIFILIIYKFRSTKFKASQIAARIWIFVLTYILWYNYLQAFFDIVYDKKEGIHTPLRSTGLSITITCKMTFGYLTYLMLQKGVEIKGSFHQKVEEVKELTNEIIEEERKSEEQLSN